MKTVSTLYKTLREDADSWYEIQVACGNRTYANDTLKSVLVSPSLLGKDGFTVGETHSTECNITVMEDSANWARMAPFTIRFRLHSGDDQQQSEWITVGTFYTDVRNEDKFGNLYITGYDAMLLTEQYWTDKIPSEQLPASFPITAREFAQLVQTAGLCTFEDLTVLDNTVAFIGLDTGSTLRDKLKDIAAAHGGNWQITSSGSLRLINFRTAESSYAIAGVAVAGIAIVGVSDSQSSPNEDIFNIGLNMQGFEDSPTIAGVSGVTLETEGGQKAITGTDTQYMLKAVCNFASTTGVAELCYSRVQGYSYKPFQITTAHIDPIAEVGDLLLAGGVGYQIMRIEWNLNKHPTANLYAPYDAEVDHEYTVLSKEAKTYRKSLAATDEKLEDYPTAAEMHTEIQQTAAAIELEADAKYVTQTEYGEYKTEVQAEFSVQANQISSRVTQTQFNNYQDQVDNALDGLSDDIDDLEESVESEFLQQADLISAKVSKTGGTNNSFGWQMNDSSHAWFANGQKVMEVKQAGLTVEGEIKATSGFIGSGQNGLTITATGFYSGMTSLNDTQHNGIYVGTDGIALGGGNFKVDAYGNLYASSGTFTGSVYANSILTGIQQNGDNAGWILGDQIGSRTIEAGNIGTGEITDVEIFPNGITTDSVSAGINASLAEADLFGAATESGANTYPAYFTAGHIVAMTSFYSDDYYVNTGNDETEYNLAGHYHRIIDNHDGTITIGSPYNSNTPPSFNIADTQFFQDSVSAVTVKSYGFEQDDEEETDYTKLYVVLGLNGVTTNTVGNLDISDSFEAGQADAQPRSIVRRTNLATGDPMPDTWNSSTNKGYIYLRATTRNSSIYYDANIEVDTNSAIYLAGGNATTITAITRSYPDGESSYPYYDSQTLGKIIEFKVTATMSNGQGSSQVLTVPADAAYNAGVASVTATAPTLDTSWATSNTGYIYRSAQKNYEVRVKSNASNNDSYSGSVIVSGAAAYNAGASTASISAVTIGTAGVPSYSSEDQVYYATCAVTGTARGTYADGTYYTDSNAYSRNVSVDVTAPYNAGKDAGAQTAYASSITGGTAGNPSWNSEDQVWYSTVPITVTAMGTKSDGTYYTNTRTANTAVDVTAAYDAGYTAGSGSGADSVYVTAMQYYTVSGEQTISYNSANKTLSASVQATLTNGNTNGSIRTVTFPADLAYNAGKSDAEAGVTLSTTASQTGWNSSTHKKTVSVSIAALNSNSQTIASDTQLIQVDASTVYDDGVTAGAQTAYVSAITTGSAGTPSYSSEDQLYYANVSVTATARGTKADGTYYTANRTITKAVDVTTVYNTAKSAGIDQGAQTAYVSAITTGVAGSPSWNSEDQVYYANVSVTATARGTKADGTYYTANRTITKAVDVTTVYNAGYTAGQTAGGGGTVQTVTSIAATASNYGTYDKAIAPSFASLYTSGAYSYGLASINLSNNTSSILRFRVPAVNDITVARPYGDMQDWDLSESNHVYVNVNLSALSNSTVLATDTGRVNVDDVVNFFATNTGAVIATNSSNYNTYDDGLTFYVQNYLYTNGNYQYARIQLRNSDGNDLSLIRIQLDKAGSSSGQITITNEATSSSVNPYYGTLPYYAYINNRHYVYVSATSTGVANRTQYIDINDIVNYAYELGGGGQSGSYNSINLYCVKRTENSAGLVTCDFSVSSYNGLFWQQGNYYTFYYQ